MQTTSMILNFNFSNSSYTVKENTAFIVIPFKEAWSNDVSDEIKKICRKYGITAQRADDIFDTKHSILDDIWKGLYEAELVIVDVTKHNANVFYELGLAQALGKDIILLHQKDGEKIPFDISTKRHISYGMFPSSFKKFKGDLSKVLRDFQTNKISPSAI